jgi:uncharacterized membrane protein (UPF0127 family)
MGVQPLNIRRADRFFSRLLGLLSAPPLQANEALLLVPCAAVHTAFMGYPIDVVFLDAAGCIQKITPNLKPWRATACPGAWQTLEVAAGEAARYGWQPGDFPLSTILLKAPQ